jgi:hypothetical protein
VSRSTARAHKIDANWCGSVDVRRAQQRPNFGLQRYRDGPRADLGSSINQAVKSVQIAAYDLGFLLHVRRSDR